MKEKIIEKVNTMLPMLNEKQRRLYLASEAIAFGRGGITATPHSCKTAPKVV